MSTRTLARRAALAGATVAAALALTGCGGGDHPTAGTGHDTPATGSPSPGATFGDADVTFAHLMIPHHRQAVAMAELADDRAADPEVRRLAGQIKAAQAPEIARMTDWLTAWGRPVPPASAGHGMPGMDHGMPGMMSDADLATLKASSGTDFDRQFLTMMIAHHEGALTMAQAELTGGANPEARALAQRIVDAQRAEIDSMRKLLDGR
ncbi:DUF305 domain-containing protein [Micromonospora sp. CB01531]|uniref:DUF305 domain-containing protein n=1 Tax=Micromonospora sp. CB01531 TaxID=1718947 RepID=UPI000939C68A|nr:DUF305 domain-containing protein [Micromonospora sp. CB01531]OKI47414.1 DUF305 domain-containing protein [Micromonospora sp. CB01531]